MKIQVIETFKFAKNCRENILFQKGNEVEMEKLGLTLEQIEYILKNCKVKKISGLNIEPKKELELEKAVIKTEKVLETKENKVEDSDGEAEKPEYLTIENKDDLIKYAEDVFSLKIDRRSSIETIRQLIKKHLEDEAN